MGVFTFEDERTSLAATLYKALVFDAPTVLPKVDEAIKNIEILKGNDAGTIKRMTFIDGDRVHYLKNKVDAIDKDNFICNYTVMEGDTLPDYYEKISYETKLVAAPNGAIVKANVKYFTKGDAELKEEDVKYGKEKVLDFSRLLRLTCWPILITKSNSSLISCWV